MIERLIAVAVLVVFAVNLVSEVLKVRKERKVLPKWLADSYSEAVFTAAAKTVLLFAVAAALGVALGIAAGVLK